jgi:hypothetical protein
MSLLAMPWHRLLLMRTRANERALMGQQNGEGIKKTLIYQ